MEIAFVGLELWKRLGLDRFYYVIGWTKRLMLHGRELQRFC